MSARITSHLAFLPSSEAHTWCTVAQLSHVSIKFCHVFRLSIFFFAFVWLLNIFNCLRKKLLQAPADFVLLVVLVEIPANLCRRIFVVGRRGAGVILFFSEMILVSSFFFQNCGWRRSVRSRMQLPGLWILFAQFCPPILWKHHAMACVSRDLCSLQILIIAAS